MPSSDRTRPTSDRVRESAFQLMAGWAGTAGEPAETMLEGFSFLDLYAGSGAVALEAASRGARRVAAVESDAGAASVARDNATTLGLPVEVVRSSVSSYLSSRTPTAFDIVWLDPPYSLDDATVGGVLSALVQGWLADDGLVVVERSARSGAPHWPVELGHTWSRRYGETVLHFADGEV